MHLLYLSVCLYVFMYICLSVCLSSGCLVCLSLSSVCKRLFYVCLPTYVCLSVLSSVRLKQSTVYLLSVFTSISFCLFVLFIYFYFFFVCVLLCSSLNRCGRGGGGEGGGEGWGGGWAPYLESRCYFHPGQRAGVVLSLFFELYTEPKLHQHATQLTHSLTHSPTRHPLLIRR